MNKSLLAKIFGWLQFATITAGQVANNAGLPHGALQWLGLVGSLLTAAAIHGASNTDGQK